MKHASVSKGSAWTACALVCVMSFTAMVPGISASADKPSAATGTSAQVPAEIADQVLAKYRAALETMARGRPRAAMDQLSSVIALAPNWAEPHKLLGFLHEYYHERARAIAEYQKARELCPTDFLATEALIALGALDRKQVAAEAASTGVEAFEQQLIDLTNQARLDAGLKPLRPSPELKKVALAHSEEMRDLNYFSHYSPTPGMHDVVARYKTILGSVPFLLGENLARRYGTQNSLTAANIEATFRDLMRSESHRRNILEPRYDETAVAIVVNDRGDYWLTQLFRREAP